ncbi:GNAT family N-acetyltransferase [Microbulbifer sp. OS29]|uniref:GNAT family N-acetyltransferase n=1 Tax=Microbulbifer okhotskensis TaxID=2926617 RepID=A0A9X2J5S0_9GAMM|nr:GNAT family N-acetyltransferase [Microbulbifer okhotskensis]MCO1332716.1 GNAT family N-acetyltransferase [Microbulbifer okhotskensis]
MQIREATSHDIEGMWSLFCGVRANGELRYSAKIGREEFSVQWFNRDLQTYVAEELPHLLGAYKLGVNFPGINSHVAAAYYLVHTAVRGRGVGRALIEHSISRAQDVGYLEMQFNYIPSTSQPTMTLYTELGFDIIETQPRAFTDRCGELCEAYVLQRFLQ